MCRCILTLNIAYKISHVSRQLYGRLALGMVFSCVLFYLGVCTWLSVDLERHEEVHREGDLVRCCGTETQ